MIVDFERDSAPANFTADVCIVGAGAAGIVLTAELLRQGKRVLLLESGGLSVEPAAQALNECSYTGQPHRGANIGRFRAVGGTTTAWGGQILELGAEDFAGRPWVPGSGWPFPKQELEPYYERALSAEDLGDSLRSDREVWQEINTMPPELGESFAMYFTRWCPEPNFARLYRSMLDSPKLCVVVHATATAMLLAEDGFRIRGIQCKTLSGKEQVFSASQYVLCLGAIESVRFLLQSSPGMQEPWWNRSGLLGKYFQSHIDFNAARVRAEDAARMRRWFGNVYLRGFKYHPKLRLAYPLQQKEEILNVAGSITCINPAEIELRRVKALALEFLRGRFSGVATEDLPRVLRQLPTMLRLAYGYRVQRRAAWPKESAFWLRLHCEQEPLSKSCITLTQERDALGMLRAQLDWRVSPLEWRTIRCFTEQVQHAFADRQLAQIEPKPELALDDGFVGITFEDSHHHMGGARMAASAADGVVSPELQLHGVENVYVCSAAVFPASGFSNPTHTLIALAIRLADHLKETAHA